MKVYKNSCFFVLAVILILAAVFVPTLMFDKMLGEDADKFMEKVKEISELEENDENIEWFLEKHKDAQIEKIFLGNMDNFIYKNDGSLTILPNEYMDGFYIAKISKK